MGPWELDESGGWLSAARSGRRLALGMAVKVRVMVADLQRVLATGGEVEQKAALLALTASPDPKAKDILAAAPALSTAAATEQLNWDALAAQL